MNKRTIESNGFRIAIINYGKLYKTETESIRVLSVIDEKGATITKLRFRDR